MQSEPELLAMMMAICDATVVSSSEEEEENDDDFESLAFYEQMAQLFSTGQ